MNIFQIMKAGSIGPRAPKEKINTCIYMQKVIDSILYNNMGVAS